MAGVRFSVVTGELSFSTSTITLLQIVSPTNQRVHVKELSISFIGTSNTAQPIRTEILFQSTAGTMTSLSPVKWNPSDSETIQTTAQKNATGEPTAGNIIMAEEIHPQTGYTWQAPFGLDIPIPGGSRLGVRVTAAAATSAEVRALCEE